ncbi:acetoacetate decarboxylase family protein [Zhongshania sp.]|uniref:acetoacetate decarboxylase family protein n=1 Tax=Zhongshania sp. TaxID=1971902 RepID=UPI00356219F8
MQDTRILYTEQPVDGDKPDLTSDSLCSKINAQQYQINGHTVTLPVTVNNAAMLMNAFTVNAAKAQALIADSGFKVVELFPGKALMQLLAVDYRENDLGDYNEAAIVFPVTTPGESKPLPFFGALSRMMQGKLANFIYRMPVNQGFTTHAGRFIWGFPKWLSHVEIDFGPKIAFAQFHDDGEAVFSISAPTGGKTRAKPQLAPSLAIRNKQAWKTIGSTEGDGLSFKLGGQMPEIGAKHPLAMVLRELGLPKKPLFSLSISKAKMRFDGPEAVAIGEPFKR